MCATENASGDPNSVKAFPIVETQAQRAAAFATDIRQMAQVPWVVGAHWFQFYDEPPAGRGDGEDCNMGLIDIHGGVYGGMVRAAAAAHPGEVHAQVRPKTAAGIPHAPQDPMSGLKGWERERGFIPPASGFPFADLYACADSQALYLGLHEMEYMDPSIYPGFVAPKSELPCWTVSVNGCVPIHVRFLGKAKPSVDRSGIALTANPNLKTSLMLKIPWRTLGLDKAPGQVQIVSGLTSHSRGFSMSWRAEEKLAP